MKNVIKLTVQQAKDMEFRLETNARNQEASLDDMLAQRQTRLSLRHSIKNFDAEQHGGIALEVRTHHISLANALYGTSRGQSAAREEFKRHDRKLGRHADFGRRQGDKRMKALAAKIADMA